ncbi:MAG: uracil-DNA glycosylase [Pseudomonadales bacterium]
MPEITNPKLKLLEVKRLELKERIIDCRHCPRLRAYHGKNRQLYPDYWNRPVPASGTHQGLTIVGLAPGLHGANKTGIPFTGDASGELLFKCLQTLGIRDQVQITNAVKCAPPENLPLSSERKNCRKFFRQEIAHVQTGDAAKVFFCLGRIAHEETLKAFDMPQRAYPFGHHEIHELDDDVWLVDTYHCSRYNINTGRITESMFLSALQSAAEIARLAYDPV